MRGRKPSDGQGRHSITGAPLLTKKSNKPKTNIQKQLKKLSLKTPKTPSQQSTTVTSQHPKQNTTPSIGRQQSQAPRPDDQQTEEEIGLQPWQLQPKQNRGRRSTERTRREERDNRVKRATISSQRRRSAHKKLRSRGRNQKLRWSRERKKSTHRFYFVTSYISVRN